MTLVRLRSCTMRLFVRVHQPFERRIDAGDGHRALQLLKCDVRVLLDRFNQKFAVECRPAMTGVAWDLGWGRPKPSIPQMAVPVGVFGAVWA